MREDLIKHLVRNQQVAAMQSSSSTLAKCSSDTVLRNMFEARKRVFVDLLKWDVPVLQDTFEVDQFDDSEATYLVLADENGRHRASARLLRTDRAHILGELFSCLCDGPVPSQPDFREITRFCIEPGLSRTGRRVARDQLVTALAEHALANGIAGYTAVAHRAWFHQIAGFGWRCVPLGKGCRVGGEDLVALQIDIDGNTLEALAHGGIYSPGAFRTVGADQGLVS